MAIYCREIDPLPIEVLRAELPSELRAAFEKHGEITFRAAFEHSQFLPHAQPFVRRLLLEAESQRTEATLRAMAAAADAAERSVRYRPSSCMAIGSIYDLASLTDLPNFLRLNIHMK